MFSRLLNTTTHILEILFIDWEMYRWVVGGLY